MYDQTDKCSDLSTANCYLQLKELLSTMWAGGTRFLAVDVQSDDVLCHDSVPFSYHLHSATFYVGLEVNPVELDSTW